MNIFKVGHRVGEYINKKVNEPDNTLTFTDLAIAAIRNIKPFELINPSDWGSDIVISDIPQQKLAGGAVGFGEPAITLYTSPDDTFFVEMYHWHSQNMTIHDHPFSGAFCVISGECFHEEFTFIPKHKLNGFQVGTLFSKRKSTMKRGGVVAINNNRELIHRNLHLLNPTITFIVRTTKDYGAENFIYTESGLAMKPDPTAKGVLANSTLDGLVHSGNLKKAYDLYKKFISSDISYYDKFNMMQLMINYMDIELVINQSPNFLPIETKYYADALRGALSKKI
ncbi:hypothetical protein [Vibrio sp.]|uniref:hypothetical protein n=1 Tax=Vibrio sp. TaxID=678 RepID=UPI00311F36AA